MKKALLFMKKTLLFLGMLILCLSLCAFGKGQAVKDAEKAIADIGEVSISSGEAIKTAEKLYSILTDNEKEKISNRLVLLEAQEAYQELVTQVITIEAKNVFDMLAEAEGLSRIGVNDIYSGASAGIQGAASSSLTMVAFMRGSVSVYPTAALVFVDMDFPEDSASNGVAVVIKAHKKCGTFERLDYLLNESQAIIQKLSADYNDDTYAPKLQEYYTAVKICADFFKSPTGNFRDLNSTLETMKANMATTKSNATLLFN